MSLIHNAWLVLQSIVGLSIRKLFGCRVGFHWMGLTSPKATVITGGKGARVYLGKKCALRPNTEIHAAGGTITLEDNVFINRNCMLVAMEQIVLKKGTTVGPGVYIYDHDHDGKGGYVTAPVSIGENAWIGAGCIILKGVTIGDHAVVAAGAVVTKDVPAHTVVGGVPASVLTRRN